MRSSPLNAPRILRTRPRRQCHSLAERPPVYERKAHSDAGTVRAVGRNAARLALVCQPTVMEEEGNGGFRLEIRWCIRCRATMHP